MRKYATASDVNAKSAFFRGCGFDEIPKDAEFEGVEYIGTMAPKADHSAQFSCYVVKFVSPKEKGYICLFTESKADNKVSPNYVLKIAFSDEKRFKTLSREGYKRY